LQNGKCKFSNVKGRDIRNDLPTLISQVFGQVIARSGATRQSHTPGLLREACPELVEGLAMTRDGDVFQTCLRNPGPNIIPFDR